MTATALQVGHLTTPDSLTVDIDGYHFDFEPGQFANLVTAGELIRTAEDPCTTSRSPSTA